MAWLRALLLGVVAHVVATLVVSLFGRHITTPSALFVAPMVEEASAVIALASLRANLRTPLVVVAVLMFGLGFAGLEFASHVQLTMRATPPFPALVVWSGPLATALFHTCNAAIAAWFIIRKQSLPAFLVCVTLHSAYNAYVLFGFTTLPASAQIIEVVLRSALLVLAIYLVTSAAAFDAEKNYQTSPGTNSPT